MPGGSFIGSLLSGPLSDRFGRKTSIQVGSIIWLVNREPRDFIPYEQQQQLTSHTG